MESEKLSVLTGVYPDKSTRSSGYEKDLKKRGTHPKERNVEKERLLAK